MVELLAAEKRSYSIGAKDLTAFIKFKDQLLKSTGLHHGDLQTWVRVTSYGHNGIYHFTARILLINHGVNRGRIFLDDGEDGFSEENYLLGSRNRKYSLGRTGRELVVEAQDLECVIRRVDLEEKS